VVRASTAAPYFFDPETIQHWPRRGRRKPVDGDFVDGGVSPHNNPALQALMTATHGGLPSRLAGRRGQTARRLGGHRQSRPGGGPRGHRGGTAAVHAVLSLKALMEDCTDQVEALMQWLSRSPTAREIDREMDKAHNAWTGKPCAATSATTCCCRATGARKPGSARSMRPTALKALEAMDDPDNIPELDRLGRRGRLQAGTG
jgi:hypothetical protein